MARNEHRGQRLPRGVTALTVPRGGRGFRASIKAGKAGEIHLGLYPSAILAGLAYHLAAEAIGRSSEPPAAQGAERQPTADEIRQVTERVRRRLGLDPPPDPRDEHAPDPDRLRTLFEVSLVGFWRDQAASQSEGSFERGIDSAAARLSEAARCLFWSRALGHPSPIEVMTDLLTRRLDRTFRQAAVARAILDDDGDEPDRLARWLVYPDAFPGARGRGFRAEVEYLYPEFGGGDGERSPDNWATVLGVDPPFSSEQIRRAYLARSLRLHPDRGGRSEDFVRLQAAYEQAKRYCEATGV